MEGLIVLLILLAVGCIICGPVALVISIIALNRVGRAYREPLRRVEKIPAKEVARPAPVAPEPIKARKEERPAEAAVAAAEEDKKELAREALKAAAERIEQGRKEVAGRKVAGLEQRIGTRWVLFAGIITVIFSVGFFLKYAYDTNLIGPLGRVVIAGVSGLLALAI
jgi:uncharacterized membrane protein